jgi:hypothetical protein
MQGARPATANRNSNMDELRLRSRTVSEIVDAAFALYRRDLNQYILIMAVATMPQLVSRLLFRSDGTLSFSTLIIGLITAVTSAFTYTVGAAAVMKLGSEVYLGEPADLGDTVRSVMPKVFALLWAGLMKAVLYFFGLLAFIVGAFYVAARFFAVGAVIVLEDKDVGEAFSRSSALSSGRKRHILNALLLVWIIYFLLSICVTLVAGIAQSTVLAIALSTVFTIVASPVIGLTEMILYYDCRIKGEGFDIERMTASMDRGRYTPGAPGVAT